jgi:hypothetical protein
VTKIEAVPVVYDGVQFRSSLEADWACTLNHLDMRWHYEPRTLTLPSGIRYVPDFWLPSLRTFIEVKGVLGDPRMHKPGELEKEVTITGAIVLIGLPPASRSLSPSYWERYIQWRSPRGFRTGLARCQECSAWQWMQPQVSRACRRCGTAHEGFIADSGEVRFFTAEPDRPLWLERA